MQQSVQPYKILFVTLQKASLTPLIQIPILSYFYINMALLDSISLFSNSVIIAQWENGKLGSILPNDKSQFVFEEHEYIGDTNNLQRSETKQDEKCPVLACGFVYYWLLYRKRKTKRAERLDFLVPKDRGKTPKEIYDIYIDARKQWFIQEMRKRPDVWKYPDLEKLFYEKNLTVEFEKNLILDSSPLLDFLDEEDKEELFDVMKNFLDYVAYIVEPYQHVMENAARQKRIEHNNSTIEAFCKHVQEDMDAKWPNPKHEPDNKVYTIESPEILEYAKNLTDLQAEILRQLVVCAGEIKTWQENPILNQYSEPEIWEACCPLYTDSIIIAFIDWGHVSALCIKDKGKLVLRKYKELRKDDVGSELELSGKSADAFKSVFLETFRMFDNEYSTIKIIPNVAKTMIDPLSSADVAVFMTACVDNRVGCARKRSLDSAAKIVDALIGLGVLHFEGEKNKKSFQDGVRRKIDRINKNGLMTKDNDMIKDIIDTIQKTAVISE